MIARNQLHNLSPQQLRAMKMKEPKSHSLHNQPVRKDEKQKPRGLQISFKNHFFTIKKYVTKF